MKKTFLIKALALCTALCLAVSCTGGSKKPGSESSMPDNVIPEVVKPEGVLRVALNEADGVNPYISNTNLTMQAAGLTFTNMVEISPQMEAVPRGLSQIIKDGLTVTLVPKPGLKFADGSFVNSADIAACINAAKQSEAYSAQLANVEKVEDNGAAAVLTLISPDSFFDYLLTIPVIKQSEVALRFPVSSGRYSASASGFTLNDKTPNLPEKIETVPLSGFDEIVSAQGVGELSLYYTETENSATSGTTSLQSLFKLNNLVFLGLNAQRGENSLFSSAEGRIAVSEMLDRQTITDKCYYQRAYPALGAINSFYPSVATKQLINASAVPDSAQQRMLALGYEKNSINGFYEKKNIRCEISLLVFSGSTYKRYAANLIKEALSQNGIYVTIDETDNFDIYKQKINAGEFDMYIGEVKLYNNMDLSVFLTPTDKSAMFWQSEELTAAYGAMKLDSGKAVEFETLFAAQMPYIPLVWRMGTLVTGKNIHGITPTLSNIFYDMSSFSFS